METNLDLFKWKQYKATIILLTVRWLKYSLSYREITEMMSERGTNISHTTIMRWVHEYSRYLVAAARSSLEGINKVFTNINERVDYVRMGRKDVGRKVIILGGGVAGMSAAQELMERGFEVEVFEYKRIPGGKARSIPFRGSGTDGRHDLPGEHGFRLFPRFYKHVIDTMKRIPYGDNTVYDNLVQVSRLDISTNTNPLLPIVAKETLSLNNIKTLIHEIFDNGLGLSKEDVEHFGSKLWQVMTSCEERVENEYQDISWWDFIEAEKYSPAFREVFGNITKTLVACKADRANTKTVGTVAAQMVIDIATPGISFVRLLDGPTNERWIDAWLRYLTENGVKYHLEAKVEQILFSEGMIKGVSITKDGQTVDVQGDYYLAAFPVEIMASFISDDIAEKHEDLSKIRWLKQSTDWMNGIQFYLNEDVTITNGHVIYFDSPWSLTSVSQKQFWPAVDLSHYGDGLVKGVLSVDVSDWETPGTLYGRNAMDCTAQEIKEEVWFQLKQGLNIGQVILRDEQLHSWFIDTDIQFESPHPTVNLEPLLINEVGTWEHRPYAYTSVPNLFLASDYVRTNTGLATMEGANEAARRAVNAILESSGSKEKPCEIWEMYKFDVFGLDVLAPWHAHDRHRFQMGLRWDGRIL